MNEAASHSSAKRREFARGWTVLLAAGVGGGTGVAVLQAYSLSALIGPLSQAFGWTRAQISIAPLYYSIATILAGTAAGALADRFGARRVAVASGIDQRIAVIGASDFEAAAD